MKKIVEIILIIALVTSILGISYQSLLNTTNSTITLVGNFATGIVGTFFGKLDNQYIPIKYHWVFNPFDIWGWGYRPIYDEISIKQAQIITQELEKTNWKINGVTWLPKYAVEESAKNFINGVSVVKKNYTTILLYLSQSEYEYLRTVYDFSF